MHFLGQKPPTLLFDERKVRLNWDSIGKRQPDGQKFSMTRTNKYLLYGKNPDQVSYFKFQDETEQQ